jgi:arylsulfatase A-like enzyme
VSFVFNDRSVLIDTAPTILELLGLEIPVGFEGHSMLDGVSRMSLFSTDYSLSLFGLRDGCWKYVYEPDVQRSKLFQPLR